MSLPKDIARCPGDIYIPPTMDFACLSAECQECARRSEGIRDYMAGADVVWMVPPERMPCENRIPVEGDE